MEKFEKSCLLDSMMAKLTSNTSVEDVLLLCESLTRTLGVEAGKVERARTAFIAVRVVEEIKSIGYAEMVPQGIGARLGVEEAQLGASFAYLCTEGLLVQAPNGGFRQTMSLWSSDVLRVRGHIGQLLDGFGELAASQKSNFEELVREYRRLLMLSRETSEELRIFGQPKLADAIKRRSEGEEIHLTKHHPGPWIAHMAQEYRTFLAGVSDKLPPDFSVKIQGHE